MGGSVSWQGVTSPPLRTTAPTHRASNDAPSRVALPRTTTRSFAPEARGDADLLSPVHADAAIMVTITPAQANRLTTLIAALSLSNTRANSHLYTDRVAEVPSIKI